MAKLDLKGSALLTVAYSGIFSFPLTFSEIKTRLLFFPRVSSRELAQALRTLVSLRQVEFWSGYFFIGRRNLVAQRQHKLAISQAKIAEGQKLVKLMKWLPGVRGLVISGSAAVDNAKPKDDLDWLVITSDHSLWLVRPVLLLVAAGFGKRRGRNGHHRDNSWCFNMFLTESNLVLPQEKRSIYTAYEVCQARFLLAKNDLESRFLTANSWADDWLPNFFAQRLAAANAKESATWSTRGRSGFSSLRFNFPALITLLNQLSFQIQYHYMRPHMTREKVSLKAAFFHPRDTRKAIYGRWLKLINLPYVKSRN